MSTTHNEYESEEERLKDLSGYDKSELDIDTSEDVQDIGWEFGENTVSFDVTVEVIENDDGTITVRQK
ncbi:MAG: hypothetical protein J6T10_17275 [Methanobrevibacter sp.]|nr:hypothetical protein [Methanobrevibacter sp.]